MSWVCPNCSNTNDDALTACFVCGTEKTAFLSETEVEEGEKRAKVVFSDFEAFSTSLKNLFRSKAPRRGAGIREAEPADHSSVVPIEREAPAPTHGRVKLGFPGSAFAKPWPEHKIKFNIETIKKMGYVKSEQKTMGGINGYCFYKEDGSDRFIRVETALVQKMAKKIE